MKPDWDKLTEEFSGSSTQLVADVDCTAEGKELCERFGVQGYPTIKWGDPMDMQDYSGNRDYESLAEFAKENLKPMCSPVNFDLCDDDTKKEIRKYQAMSDQDLQKAIKEKEDSIKEAEEAFGSVLEELQATYEKAAEDKNRALDGIIPVMSTMKAVFAHSVKEQQDEL